MGKLSSKGIEFRVDWSSDGDDRRLIFWASESRNMQELQGSQKEAQLKVNSMTEVGKLARAIAAQQKKDGVVEVMASASRRSEKSLKTVATLAKALASTYHYSAYQLLSSAAVHSEDEKGPSLRVRVWAAIDAATHHHDSSSATSEGEPDGSKSKKDAAPPKTDFESFAEKVI